MDVEWRAFEAGVKPAFRVSAAPQEAASIVARYLSRGASVAQSDPTLLRGAPSVIVYVARSSADAAALRDVERRLRSWPPRERRVAALELGRGLGYPRCCVIAFVQRNHGGARDWISARLERKRGHDAYLGARDALVPRPRPRINPLLMPQQRAFISFDPCRYDCSYAVALADRVAAVLEAFDAEWVALVDRELARPIVVAASGARAHVELDQAGEHPRIRAARAPRDFRGEVREIDRRFAHALVGSVIGRRGLVRGWRAFAPPVLVDFSVMRNCSSSGGACLVAADATPLTRDVRSADERE